MSFSSHKMQLWKSRALASPVWVQEFIKTARRQSAGFACTSMAMARSKGLTLALGEAPVFYSRLLPLKGQCVVGWGRRWSGRRAAEIAGANGKPALFIEDGFIRSVGRLDMCLSYLVDPVGVHYDATAPSHLEDLIKRPLTDQQKDRAQNLIHLWQAHRVSKYNDQPDTAHEGPENYVLVVDQTYGDASVSYGLADDDSFRRMLAAALADFPNDTVVVKTHPDVITRGRRGYFDISELKDNPRIRISADACHPVALLEHAKAVFTVTSQMGFEAMIWGKQVHCFGMPFYAGWGLTKDNLPPPSRRTPVSKEQLIHAALIDYPRYIDPVQMTRCEVEQTIAHVGLQRHARTQFGGKITALGFSPWKRPFIKSFLQGSDVTFAKHLTQQSASTAHIAVWGSGRLHDYINDTQVLRIEDGFLRSSGLGADLVQPLSLVIDDIGIYYDATAASRLEHILNTQTLDHDQADRAENLRSILVALDVTKYNLGNVQWKRPDTGKPVLLVIGQVETDASIRLGSPDIQSNIALLRRVRQDNPDAYIIYKPHPDVIAGLRKRDLPEDNLREYADNILTSPVSIGALVANVDAIHTMTSLLGFEALIRGGRVICHGLPFYAGWGLTEDKLDCARRKRHLTVHELVYGALISYPRYICYKANCFIAPEHAVAQLAAWSKRGPSTRSWHRKLLRLAIVTGRKVRGSKR